MWDYACAVRVVGRYRHSSVLSGVQAQYSIDLPGSLIVFLGREGVWQITYT